MTAACREKKAIKGCPVILHAAKSIRLTLKACTATVLRARPVAPRSNPKYDSGASSMKLKGTPASEVNTVMFL